MTHTSSSRRPSLSDYDKDNFDEAESFIIPLLDRWGDLLTPFRLNDQPPAFPHWGKFI